jgi:hypothetical protein
MINNRLTALERSLTTNQVKPSTMYTEGVETEQQAVDRFNKQHGTNYPLEAFNLIQIVFSDNPKTLKGII